MAAKKKSPKGKGQGELPGMEESMPKDRRLHDKAVKYCKLKKEFQATGAACKEAKDILEAAMLDKKLKFYKHGTVKVEMEKKDVLSAEDTSLIPVKEPE